jgi:hypothetical protein
MGFLRRFLTGDVLEEAELSAARTDGIELHARKRRAAVTYDDYRAPGRRSRHRRVLSSGGLLVTARRVVLWAAGERQLDLDRASLPSPLIEASADGGVLEVAFRAEHFHADRSGSVRVRLWTPDAERARRVLAP